MVSLDALLLMVAGAAFLARALFVAADAALSGVSPERAEELQQSAPGSAHRALLSLKRDLEGTHFATRGGSVAALALAASAAGAASLRLVEPLATDHPLGQALAAALGGGATTLAILVVDLVPRSLAVARPEPWAARVALPTWLAARLLAPAGRLLRAATDRLLAPFGARATFRAPSPPREDLERYLLQQALAAGDGPPPELVHSLFSFSTRTAREVMVPRTEVKAVPIDMDPEELVQFLAEHGHSRMPVYEGDIDHVVGVLHSRDVVPLLAHPVLIKLPDVIRPATFVPWASRIDRILRMMQRERIHMAMVTDEHGGFMGIVTLEDILEEIVGDIRDEHDEGRSEVEPLPDGSFRVDAGIDVADFNERFGTSLPTDDGFDTLAGFLNQQAGAIPEGGSTFDCGPWTLTVEERTPRRVLSVRVARRPAEVRAG